MTKSAPLALTFLSLATGSAFAETDDEVPPVFVLAPGTTVEATGAPGQVAPVPPPTAAPQNEDWQNVSHVNGTAVPVGERGNYLYRWKKTNVASNPIGWMVGFYGLSISQAVSTNIAVRGDANLIELHDSSVRGYELGASVAIYFKRVYQGPFLEPGIIVRDFDDKDEPRARSDRASMGPSVVFGWHWTFDSGLNAAVAFGLMRDVAHDTMEGGSDLQPSGYFRIGYAF